MSFVSNKAVREYWERQIKGVKKEEKPPGRFGWFKKLKFW